MALSIWTLVPWGLLAWGDRIPLADPLRVLTLALFVALSSVIYLGVDDSSTGVLGVLFLPLYLALILGLAMLVDVISRAVRRRR